ncbi:hypothetical protein [Lentilitoribacter sp. EG35]|uniref:hypothetical protein n=1 Tax=Lentilitoribacter sp. EG35 TaxID=3234192 RepID=UPI0034617AB4
MNGAQLDALITGNTLYVDIPKGAPGAPEGGIAPIYYATDGTVKAHLPAGPMLAGRWSIDGDQYCIDWNNGPQNSCTELVRKSVGFAVVDVALQQPRGTVNRIQTGNPERL